MTSAQDTGRESRNDPNGPDLRLDDLEEQRVRSTVRSRIFDEDPEPVRIGRFVLLRNVGQGGMGVVYAAYDEELDRRVAVKVLTAGRDLPDEEAAGRLRREAQAMAKLSHPNVVQVYEVGMVEARLFMAMEFIKGPTLKQWIANERRTVHDILDVFVQAGRGLAAAHAAGLVHRDFKPENVMLGDGGRVRVLDFGLAQLRQANSPGISHSEPRATDSGHEQTLTATGRVMGTPAYMSPEQFEGASTDAKTDQFSFCVALYEALYGTRPFAGDTPNEVAHNVTAGTLAPTPSGARVPTSVRKALLRGLERDPALRWPTMEALLTRLSRSSRRTWTAWGAVVTTATLVGVILLSRGALDDPCARSTADIQAVWNGTRKGRIKAAFGVTNVAFGEAAYRRTVETLDAYAQQWENSSRSACELMLEGSDARLDELGKRVLCLSDRLRQLDEMATVLEAADAAVVRTAPEAVDGLERVADCSDEQFLVAWDQALAPDVREQLEQIERAMAVARANLMLGKYHEGLAALEGQEQAAERVNHGSTRARVAALRGRLQTNLGDLDAAEDDLRRAVRLADGVGDDATRAWAAARLVYVIGFRQARFAEGLAYAEDALAAVARIGGSPEIRATIHNNMGIIARRQGDYDRAREHLEAALAMRRELFGDRHSAVAASLTSMGNLHRDTDDYPEAEDFHQQALSILEGLYGPDHPAVSRPLHNLGNVQREAGDFAGAMESYARALAIRKAALGERHVAVARTLHNLAETQLAAGETARALSSFESAADLREAALGSAHPDLAYTFSGVGRTHLGVGDHTQAIEYLERAMAIYDARESPVDELAQTAFALARALDSKDPPRARAMAKRALAAYAQSGQLADKQREVELWLERR